MTQDIPEFNDPRLVAVYETLNPYSPDAQPRFYRELADELSPRLIVDVGCGTGLITRELAGHGYDVIGLDPSPLMIDVARRHPGSDKIRWIVDDTSALGRPGADLAILTGHVAQFFVTDESWHTALAHLRDALRPGGHLAFETRNPSARGWERWTHESRRSVEDPHAGRIDTWVELRDFRDNVASCVNHYRFAETGEEVISPVKLRFRSRQELVGSLADAGFAVERVYGDWDRRPAGPATRELIVVARRA